MNAPRFTDQHRYPPGRPYVPASATDIRATLERERARIAQQKAAKPRTNTKRDKHG